MNQYPVATEQPVHINAQPAVLPPLPSEACYEQPAAASVTQQPQQQQQLQQQDQSQAQQQPPPYELNDHVQAYVHGFVPADQLQQQQPQPLQQPPAGYPQPGEQLAPGPGRVKPDGTEENGAVKTQKRAVDPDFCCGCALAAAICFCCC
eukprot:m.143600 g.143600  ORF g.143600 m.143600 type:complete len:149 (+) comp16742_c5_seq2:1831-2277(+)